MEAMESGRRRLLALAAIATLVWLVFALLAIRVLAPATRILSFALVTGALLVAGVYEMNKKDRAWKQAVLLLCAAWLVCGATLYAANRIAPEVEIKGPLLAGHAPTPVTACAGAKATGDALLMIVGRNALIGRGAGPFTPLRVGSCPALSVTRTAKGLVVNAFGYDSDNNVVYRIRDNVFEQIVGGFLTAHRPDPSRLVVGDDHGPTVLEISYLNNNVVEISGTFRCGDSAPVRVSREGIFVGRMAAAPDRCVSLDGGASQGLAFSEPAPHS